jgi:hypothetical protein
MNPNVFDIRDDFKVGKIEQNRSREDLWQWRRAQWATMCRMGPNHIFVFNLPKKFGKTHILHHIASKGFPDDTPIFTIHLNQRLVDAFKAIGATRATSITFENICNVKFVSGSVVLFDDPNFLKYPYQPVVEALKKHGSTVFIVGTDLRYDAGDYHATLLPSFLI